MKVSSRTAQKLTRRVPNVMVSREVKNKKADVVEDAKQTTEILKESPVKAKAGEVIVVVTGGMGATISQNYQSARVDCFVEYPAAVNLKNPEASADEINKALDKCFNIANQRISTEFDKIREVLTAFEG